MIEPKVKSIRGTKSGRGFSIKELQKSGISIQQAKSLKIRVDRRRKSFYDSNIDELKKIAKNNSKPKKIKKPVKKTAQKKEGVEKKSTKAKKKE